jgi:hypothetical protein
MLDETKTSLHHKDNEVKVNKQSLHDTNHHVIKPKSNN